MKLTEPLPRGVRVNGKFYRLNLDFRRVLRFLDVLDRDDLFPGAKMYLAMRCLMRRPPKQCALIFKATNELLFPDREKPNRERITDFNQDADLIRAAFLQCYRIDLYREKLHWLQFRELLSGLPTGTRYADVLSIRAREIPEATKYNQKEREWLMKAKESCALKISEDEKQRIYARGVSAVFAGMLSMAKGGKGNE